MSNKKMTMVEKYTKTMALLRGEMVEDFSVEDALEFLADRKAKTIAKNTPNPDRKLTPKEQEKLTTDEGFKDAILEILSNADGALAVGDIQKQNSSLCGLSNQKMTYLLTSLRKMGKVFRSEVKGKPHYSLTKV